MLYCSGQTFPPLSAEPPSLRKQKLTMLFSAGRKISDSGFYRSDMSFTVINHPNALSLGAATIQVKTHEHLMYFFAEPSSKRIFQNRRTIQAGQLCYSLCWLRMSKAEKTILKEYPTVGFSPRKLHKPYASERIHLDIQ